MKKRYFIITVICVALALAITVGIAVDISSRQLVADRDVFAECALVAKAQMAEYSDKSIEGYTRFSDLCLGNFIGICFNFEGGGYVLVTSYDYQPRIVEPEKPSPFPSDPYPESGDACVFSIDPVSAKLCTNDGDYDKYYTFSGNGCYIMTADGVNGRVLHSEDGKSFSYSDIISPNAYSKSIVSIGGDVLNDYCLRSAPNEALRSKSVAVSKKSLTDLGCDLNAFADEVRALRTSQGPYYVSGDYKYDYSTYIKKLNRNGLRNFIKSIEKKLTAGKLKGGLKFNDYSDELTEDTFDLR